ncbi:hypothetical protein [Burkholderia sp. BE17]|uniref:hypothetical protein n=1 Tax=Burkholderia sp. BE17 TaxID=2656644 RepID=UPI00128D85E5|nr:hypothetical protein [Burkholderia sp. BE17]MPV68365.1 hypothetical protein [Burkholderia sp. BE17]
MNWLSEYFAQRTSPLSLSLWAHPPLVLGPDGPVCRPPHSLPYPGVELVFSPAEQVERDGRIYTLPARYEATAPLAARVAGHGDAEPFFRTVSIFAPSQFNPDFFVTINGEYAFAPVFRPDGSPGFSGMCATGAGDGTSGRRTGATWLFQGYLSI